MATYDAILLAGDRRGAKRVLGKNKSLLEVKGIPSFIRVISALQKVKSIGEIRVVGPVDKINPILEKFSNAWQGPKTVRAIPQKDNIIDNVWKTFLEMLPGYEEGMEPTPDQKEKTIFVVAGDIPLVTTAEINEFISKCDMDIFDYYVGAVSEKTLSHFAPKAGSSGIRLAVLPMREKKYRINNLHMIKPFKIDNRYRLQQMYELRYQRQLQNIWKLFFKILQLEGGMSAAWFYFLIQTALFFRKFGVMNLAEKIRSHLSLSTFQNMVGRVLGTKVAVAETTYGGSAIDIDSRNEYTVINKKFDEWMEYQNKVKP